MRNSVMLGIYDAVLSCPAVCLPNARVNVKATWSCSLSAKADAVGTVETAFDFPFACFQQEAGPIRPGVKGQALSVPEGPEKQNLSGR